MDESLQKKLREVLKKTGMTLTEIAKANNVPKENMFKWFKGTRPSDASVYNKLMSYLDKILLNVPDISLTEGLQQEHISRYKSIKVRIPIRDYRKPAFQTNEKAPAGTVMLIEEELHLIAERIDIPHLGYLDGTIEVTDDSMAPVFVRGSRAAIARLNDPRILTWGKYFFIIDKNWNGIIRRIYPGKTEETIELVSENAQYPPITRQWNQLEAILQVKAAIIKP